jgi:aspartyl-tRNA(Asn)/glutamyl-tRNA(Gln) amidotransferase subunit C
MSTIACSPASPPGATSMTQHAISPGTLQQIAHLARLGLNDAQRETAAAQLGAMLGVFAALDACDVSAVAPLFHPGDMTLSVRADVVTHSDQHVAFQDIAPDVAGQMYLVPKVLDA